MDNLTLIDISKEADDQLRDYQLKYKAEVYEAWEKEDKSSVMLQMPTGTGKTRLFSSIVKDIHQLSAQTEKARKTLILVHRIELIHQTVENIGYRYGIAHGVITANYQQFDKYPTQIASVQTLTRRLPFWKKKNFDYIIVDEAHHALADSYQKIFRAFPEAKILGVTATPYRLNGASFFPLFQKLIVSETVEWFIQKKHLIDYRYYSIPPKSIIYKSIEGISDFDISGDFSEKGMMQALDNNYVRADILEAYKRHAKGKKGIVYTINKAHNVQICQLYNSIGVTAVAIDSDTKPNERANAIQLFKAGKIEVLCNVNIFSEGFDCPDIDFIQLARPTKSLSLFLQQVGRGLRTHDGSTHVIFLDNVGSYLRFGLPSETRDWKYFFHGFDPGSIFIEHEQKYDDDRLIFIGSDEIQHGDEEVTLLYNSENEDKIVEFDENSLFPILIKQSPYKPDALFDADKFEYSDIVDIFLNYYDELESYEENEDEDYVPDKPEFNIISNIQKVRIANKYGLFNTDKEELVLPVEYNEIYLPYGTGYAIIAKGEYFGVLNCNDFTISIECKYDYIESLYYSFRYDSYLVEKGGNLGVINDVGIEIIPIEYEDIYPTPSFFNVQKNGYWKTLSIGRQSVEEWDDWHSIEGNKKYLLVEYASHLGFLDVLKLKLLTPLQYSNVQKIHNYFLCTIKRWRFGVGGRMEVLDGSLNVVIPPEYERIEFLSEKLLKVQGWAEIDEKVSHGFGIIDINNRVLIAPTYSDLIWENGTLFVRKDNLWHVIDWEENILASAFKRKDALIAYKESTTTEKTKKKRPRIIKRVTKKDRDSD